MVEVDVRLARVPGVTTAPDRLPFFNLVTLFGGDAAALQVCELQVRARRQLGYDVVTARRVEVVRASPGVSSGSPSRARTTRPTAGAKTGTPQQP